MGRVGSEARSTAAAARRRTSQPARARPSDVARDERDHHDEQADDGEKDAGGKVRLIDLGRIDIAGIVNLAVQAHDQMARGARPARVHRAPPWISDQS